MKTIDFRKIPIQDIEGNVSGADVSKALGNLLYMQGQNIEECELGRDIYHKGEVELTDQQRQTVKAFAATFPYMMRSSIEKALTK